MIICSLFLFSQLINKDYNGLWRQFTQEEPAYLYVGNGENSMKTKTIRKDPFTARSTRGISYWKELARSESSGFINKVCCIILFCALL